ncbi:hypothetical protein [Microbacterium sp. SS28]|uniref:hypothetical protein n=1 Tax=Microbacterium sp. SS28 TaxID=2919948 RepID=UPI001FAA011A|nr:hypothetical protein [Microbacterium sp. SS28]
MGSFEIEPDSKGVWEISPGTTDDKWLTVQEARAYVRELRLAIAAAEALNRHKPRVIAPCDVAIATEVSAVIAEREWGPQEAAARFGWSTTKLASRLRGHSSWTVDDLVEVSDGLSEDDGLETITRLFGIGMDATKVAHGD